MTVNARAETVDKAPSFCEAFAKRRCLIPADGFYEWRKTAKPKLPFALRHERRTPIHLCWALEKTGKIPNPESGYALARLSQANRMNWSHRSSSYAGDSSSSNITRPGLGETDDGDLKALLLPYPADQMRMWEISPRVNSAGE